MTIWRLLEALKERLEHEFKGFTLKDETGERVPLKFFLQNLPGTEAEYDTRIFPYVVIRFERLHDIDYETAFGDVLFVIGIFDDDRFYQGYKDVINIQEKIRQSLCRDHLLDGRFILQFPLSISTSDDFSDSTYPYFFGIVMTKWKVPVMLQNMEAFD